MASDDTRFFSRDEIAAMKTKGEVRTTPADAPKFEPGEEFWKNARIVSTRRRLTSVRLRVDPDTVAFFRAGGRGHVTRMANVLKAYAEAQSKR